MTISSSSMKTTDLVAENRRGHEADVAHGAVAPQRDALDHVGELELLEAAVQAAQLGGTEDERVDVGEVVDDLAHLVLGAVLDGLVGGGDDDDDLPRPSTCCSERRQSGSVPSESMGVGWS